MITDAEFVAIKSFDATLAHCQNEGQRLVNKKNTDLLRLRAVIDERDREIAVLTAALVSERAKSAGMQRQMAAFISRQ